MTVSFHKGCYGVRLATSAADLAACQTLRHTVFFGSPGRDADHFDAACEHLMIADTLGLVATCRILILNNGSDLDRSYAAARYDLERLSNYRDPMMELGRFCIAPRGQDADVLRLIWGALAQIVDRAGVGFVLGCSSFAGVDPAPYAGAFGLMAARAQAPAKWAPGPRAPEIVPLGDAVMPDAMKNIPPLLRSYLTMGGWVSDHAVVDRQMNTLHVFTGLEIAAIPARRAAAMRAVAPVEASGGGI